jgi:P-type Cu+ transporter
LTVIGNAVLMKINSISVQTLTTESGRLAEEGKTPLWIAINGSLAGIIAVADTVKPTSIEAIRRFHHEGLRIVMLTGDNERTARAIARQVAGGELYRDRPLQHIARASIHLHGAGRSGTYFRPFTDGSFG